MMTSKIEYALKEIFTTEETFVKKLNQILPCLRTVNDQGKVYKSFFIEKLFETFYTLNRQ